MDHLDQFAEKMREHGLVPPGHIYADGNLHRFSPTGAGKQSAWYVCHLDGIPAGAFGDWRTGEDYHWRATMDRAPSLAETMAHQTRIKAMRQQRDEEAARRAEKAKVKAAKTWADGRPASNHPYLQRKKVLAHGTRTVCPGTLVVPVRVRGETTSLQFISPAGEKKFLPGGVVREGYYPIGTPDRTLAIAEGFATAASIHEATGIPCVVAFNAGNLEPVAKAMRARFPNVKMVICADDDTWTPGNPGVTYAAAAAHAAGAKLAIPDWSDYRPHGVTDFNDLAIHHGHDAVRLCVDTALRTP